jgi:sugar phosphate isomerase/epimerase
VRVLRYSVNEVMLDGATLADDVALLVDLGVPALGVDRRKLRAAGVTEAVARLADSPLAILYLQGAGPFTLTDPSRWRAEVNEVRQALDDTVALGAGCLQMTTGGPGAMSYDEAEGRFLVLLHEILADAADRQIVLAPEHNHALRMDLGFVHSLHDMMDLVDKVDSPWFRVCAEVNNAWIERHLYTDLAARHDRIAMLQINDFAAGTLCTPERVALGDGIIPLERIITTMLDAGFGGWFDLEVVGTQVSRLGSRAVVERSLAWLQRFADR